MSCSNDFINLERMETIGDSFLKFVVTVHLYLTYPEAHEGKLSHLRSRIVSYFVFILGLSHVCLFFICTNMSCYLFCLNYNNPFCSSTTVKECTQTSSSYQL